MFKLRKNIIRICDEIKNKNKCSGCGGSFDYYTCKYCGSEDLGMKSLIDELTKCLDVFNNYDSEMLDILYTIRDVNIRGVNDLIKRYNYEEVLRDRYSSVLNMTISDNMGRWTYQQVIYFLENDLFVGGNRSYFITILMKKLICFELDLDVDDILKVIKYMTEMFMGSSFKNPKCVYDKLDENVNGEAYYNRIYLDKDSIIQMLNVGDIEGVLETIFHEYTHTFQDYSSEVLKKVSYTILIQSKEKLIRRVVNGYYDENYHNYNAEVEARYGGAYLTIAYLNSLGLKCLNEEYFRGVMASEQEFLFNDARTINGVKTTVDEAFSMFVTDASVLEQYPVLRVQYKNNNGELELKSREEILDDYEKYKRGEILLNGTDDEIKLLYDYLLGNISNRSINM